MTEAEAPRRRSRWGLVASVAVGVLAAVWSIMSVADRSWRWAFLAALMVVVVILGLRSRPLELLFEVGSTEQHRVMFRFNKFWGNVAITVDGRPVVRDLRLLSVKLTKTYRFTVGVSEIHEVRIEKDRKAVLAGGRAQPVRAYVDNVLTAEGVA